MGEVYRADDLKLAQAVALKFLPREVENDAIRLEALLNEVKLARQISNPNVCRVYDVVEVDGHHFLSMEYVDGEDLATLLKRIGRLPKDKAVQIARQLCAGLASAHEQGVIHRDLKPANIMIDGRGRARITDFGLAGFADQLLGGEARGGTPAYMAPEQSEGKGVSVRSDLYSLGLVLYELFTGAAAFKASTARELARLKLETTPTSPSRLIEGFDPAVERVILRCLEPDPRNRPPSALAVAAALPGGDPLAAALAAGETPSPELVAEAGGVGGMKPGLAALTFAGIVVGLVLIIAVSAKTQFVRIVPLPKSPDVLAERAREITERLGYADPPLDSNCGFDYDVDALDHLVALDPTSLRWKQLSDQVPGVLYFWYRQGPEYLIPLDSLARSPRYEDPPLVHPGMTGIQLDPKGRLLRFERVPPEKDETRGPWPDADWVSCFTEAGLDLASFKQVDPTRSPPSYADTRAAWEGDYPGASKVPIRIEAAAFQGKPVYFRIFEPWTPAGSARPEPENRWVRISYLVFGIVAFLTLIGGMLLALRNYRLGRGDRKGALRLALFVLSTDYLAWIFKAHHVPELSELGRAVIEFGEPLIFGCIVWVFYLALEPYVRRLWPSLIVSWVRLLDGRFRDPLVGRDLFIGLLTGVGLVLLDRAFRLLPAYLGFAVPGPDRGGPFLAFQLVSLRGVRYSLGNFIGSAAASLIVPMLFMVLLLIFRIVLRRQWLAVGALVVLSVVFGNPAEYGANPYLYLIYNLLLSVAIMAILFRFGLLVIVTAYFVQFFLNAFPLTLDLSAWYAGNTFLIGLFLIGLAVWALRISLAGRPMLRDAILQE